MGLDFSYEIIATRDTARRLVEVVCLYVEPDDATRLATAAATDIEKVVPLARHPSCESSQLCLRFQFPTDEHLRSYGDQSHGYDPSERVSVGCVWSSLQFGGRFVHLRCTAATTSMSLVFQRSDSIRRTFAEIGRMAAALLVAFDDETGEPDLVWPRSGRLGASVVSDMMFDDRGERRVDCYCSAILRALEVRESRLDRVS